jgi:hypothetical protein
MQKIIMIGFAVSLLFACNPNEKIVSKDESGRKVEFTVNKKTMKKEGIAITYSDAGKKVEERFLERNTYHFSRKWE